MEKRIRVVVADCHYLVRVGLREFLAAEPGLLVVGEASTADEALQLVAERSPDVLVHDLQLPGLTCQELLSALKRGCPSMAILVLTLFTEEPYTNALRRAGADAWLAKQAPLDELAAAVKAVAAASVAPPKAGESTGARMRQNNLPR